MLLDLVAATSILTNQPAVPVAAVCRPVVQIDDLHIDFIDMRCPDDVVEAAALQSYATRVAAVIDMPLDLAALRPAIVTHEVAFEYRDGHWSLMEPVPFLRVEPEFPFQAAERRLRGRCDLRVTVQRNGLSGDSEIACNSIRYGARAIVGGQVFELSVLDAVNRFRWFVDPDDGPNCKTLAFNFFWGNERRPSDWSMVPVEGAPVCEELSVP